MWLAGKEAWAERLRPLCTEAGWSFWQPVGAQAWPDVMETEHAVQDVEVLGTKVVETTGAGTTVEVRLRLSYTRGGVAGQDEVSNQTVMIRQDDGGWLMDAPPIPTRE